MNSSDIPRKINAGVINTPTLIRSGLLIRQISLIRRILNQRFFLRPWTALKRGLDLQISYSRPFASQSDSLDGVPCGTQSYDFHHAPFFVLTKRPKRCEPCNISFSCHCSQLPCIERVRFRRDINCYVRIRYAIQLNLTVCFDSRADFKVLINAGVVEHHSTILRMDIVSSFLLCYVIT